MVQEEKGSHGGVPIPAGQDFSINASVRSGAFTEVEGARTLGDGKSLGTPTSSLTVTVDEGNCQGRFGGRLEEVKVGLNPVYRSIGALHLQRRGGLWWRK